MDGWDREPEHQETIARVLGLWSVRQEALVDIETYRSVLLERLSDTDLPSWVSDHVESANLHEDPFETACRRVERIVGDLYRRYGHWPHAELALAVSIPNNDLFPDASGYGEHGCSAFMQVQNEVIAAADPSRLGPPSLASLPYVLTHELFCHAAQAVWPNRSDDPFTEGWMDFGAVEIVRAHAPALLPGSPVAAESAAVRLSTTLRRMSADLPEPHRTTRAARQRGWKAAESVYESLRRILGDQARDAFLRLCVELNQTAASVDDHTVFVQVVNMRASSRGPDRAAFLLWLRNWWEGHIAASEMLALRGLRIT